MPKTIDYRECTIYCALVDGREVFCVEIEGNMPKFATLAEAKRAIDAYWEKWDFSDFE